MPECHIHYQTWKKRRAQKTEILTEGTYRSYLARPMSKFQLCNFEFRIHFISLGNHSQIRWFCIGLPIHRWVPFVSKVQSDSESETTWSQLTINNWPRNFARSFILTIKIGWITNIKSSIRYWEYHKFKKSNVWTSYTWKWWPKRLKNLTMQALSLTIGLPRLSVMSHDSWALITIFK